jgi:NTP pyrophosphatase (non-canonical NTP hydrolase)
MNYKTYTYNDYQAITRETSGCDDLSVLALGLVGESIEFIDAVDQIYSNTNENCLVEIIEEVVKEAGDVFWYAARIMDVMNEPFQLWQIHSASTTDNFNNSCRKSFRKKFRVVRNAGVVSEHVKKVTGHGHDLNKELVCKYIGDIVRDIAHILKGIYGQDALAVCMHTNVEKLRKRYPNGFEVERSKNRRIDIV